MRLLILAPFLLLLVLFALSNTAPVAARPVADRLVAARRRCRSPSSAAWRWRSWSAALLVWISELGQRRRARRAEQAVRLLEAQVQELKARLPQAALAPAAPPRRRMTESRLIVALDTADTARAAGWAAAVAPHCGLFKLGLEFFLANGAAGVRAIAGRPIFLDLKLHDIPNTVAGAVRAVLPLAPRMLTVHAAGGAAMVAAARQAAEAAGPARPMILAVTVLTSLDAADLAATGVARPPAAQVLRLARLAIEAGRGRPGVQPAGGGDAARRAGRRSGTGGARHPPGRQRGRRPGADHDPGARRWRPAPTGSWSAGRSPPRPIPAPGARPPIAAAIR